MIQKEVKGYRGYVASRPILGMRAPQHVQNIIIRDYAEKNGLLYKLSATEYCMKNSFLILEKVINEINGIDGIIAYSMFMFPENNKSRQKLFSTFIDEGKEIHSALEGLSLKNKNDIEKWENIYMTNDITQQANIKDSSKWLI